MHIKICGVTTPEDAEMAAKLGATAIGLNFWPESPRYIDLEKASDIISRLPPFVDPVGVFVYPELTNLQTAILELLVHTVQLHAFRSEEWPRLLGLWGGRSIILAHGIAELQDRLELEAELDRWQRKLPLILNLRDPSGESRLPQPSLIPAQVSAMWPILTRHKNAASVPKLSVLFDAKVPGQHGGTGQQAPWHLLADWQMPYPLILAGGLTPENVAEAIRIVRPYGVDVASGVESAPGVKDAEKMRRFIGNALQAAAKHLTPPP